MISIVKIEFLQGICPGMKSVPAICKKLSAAYLRSLLLQNLKPLNPELWDNCAVSNMMPFQGADFYIEKPALITEGLQNLSLADHKFHRLMKYLKITELRSFFDGSYNFASNAKKAFGRYQKTAEGDRFVFSEGAGLYFLLKTPGCLSSREQNVLCQLLERAIPCDLPHSSVLVSVLGENPHSWTDFFQTDGDLPVLSLTNLDTRCLTAFELERLLEGAAFQAAYTPDGFGVTIQAGAWFPHAASLPNEIVCIVIK